VARVNDAPAWKNIHEIVNIIAPIS
jgi:hypothetical protein